MNTKPQGKIIPLDDLTSLHISGDDSTRFLHAQFTNDLENLAVNGWQYSGYCTPKGRLLAFFTIARLGENEYVMILPKTIGESILPRLRMFVMRDNVTISAQQEQSSLSGILGPADTLSDTGLSIEAVNGRLSNKNNQCILTLDIEQGRYLCLSNGGLLDNLDSSSFESADRAEWTLLDIKAGIPAIVSDTQEAYVPQMVNLDLIGAVNFKKGCYPGQEIVARVHYLGKIKQRMYVLSSESDSVVEIADKIYIAGQPDKPAGTVVQSAIHGQQQIIQAVLQTKSVDENADFRLAADDGEMLTLAAQPYPVAADKE